MKCLSMFKTGYLWLVYQLGRRPLQKPSFNACVGDCVRVNVVCGFCSSFVLLVSACIDVLIDKLLLKLWQESC